MEEISNMSVILPDRDEEHSPRLRVIQGGKEPQVKPEGADPQDPDWLSKLEIGTNFVTADKFGDYIGTQWVVLYKTDKTVFLEARGHEHPIPVIPKKFCRRHQLIEVLSIRKEE